MLTKKKYLHRQVPKLNFFFNFYLSKKTMFMLEVIQPNSVKQGVFIYSLPWKIFEKIFLISNFDPKQVELGDDMSVNSLLFIYENFEKNWHKIYYFPRKLCQPLPPFTGWVYQERPTVGWSLENPKIRLSIFVSKITYNKFQLNLTRKVFLSIQTLNSDTRRQVRSINSLE